MDKPVEPLSEAVHRIILKHEDIFYQVDRVTVQLSTRRDMYNAIFSAKRLCDSQLCDLDFEISPNIYSVLVEYAKLDSSDLLLVLLFENNVVEWRFVSESWIKQQIENKTGKYVV